MDKYCFHHKDSLCYDHCGPLKHNEELDDSCPEGEICCTYPPIRDLYQDYELTYTSEEPEVTTEGEEETRTRKTYTFYW